MAATGCAIVADVRLDNRADLLATLPEPPAATASDAALILRAYEAWGLDAPRRLRGDFAFLLWDPRRERLVAARDNSGQRTLFYRIDGRGFAAASEIHALLQDPAVVLAPNEERIRDFLVPLNMFRNEKERPDTFYAGISSLMPGHFLVLDPAGLRLRCYWELGHVPEIRYRDDAQYAEHFLDVFRAAVGARLRTSRPMGAMLSGGLDSSSVVSTAHTLWNAGTPRPPAFTAYSLVFDGLECDERPLIRDIRRRYDFDTEFVSPHGYYEWLQLAPRGFRPSPIQGLNERDALFQAASDGGARALLSGDFADAGIRGTAAVFDALLRHGRLGELRRRLTDFRDISGQPLLKTFALHGLAPLLPLWAQRLVAEAYTRRYIRQERWRLLPRWMPPALRDDLSDRHLRLTLEIERGRRFSNDSRHLEHYALYPAEQASNPLGWPLENWRPFADRRLHELLLAVPPEIKYAPQPETDQEYARTKRLLREAMRGILPESVRTRKVPTHFASVFAQDVDRRWETYQRAFGSGSQSEVVDRGYVERASYFERLQAIRGGAESGDLMYVMRIAGLESWLRTFHLPRAAQVTFPSLWRGQTASRHSLAAA